MFDSNIKFKYTWRPYQERTLKNIHKYLKDKKIHIVAAPGSGKTILGLELARLLKEPVLILAPTVTIKNQWIDRFISSFTNYKEVPDWISTDVYNLKFFNVLTYQALHYAYKRLKIKKEDDPTTDDFIEDIEVSNKTTEEIKKYDIIQEIKNKNIKTIILDEAHHLKSEWWNSLTKVIEPMNNSVVVALTATPPYDSEHNEWKKYISLCGDIDNEITVPELVKAKNLCPHQDYIYFNKPTKEEQIKIDDYNNKLEIILNNIKNNDDLALAIKNHKYIKNPYKYQEELLDNVEYYASLLIYLNYRNFKIEKDNLNILGDIKKLPSLDNNYLEIMLRNIIISDRKNYSEYEDTIKEIEIELNKIGIIDNSNLSFNNNKALEPYFLNSLGKLNSISNILKLEYNSLKNKLRMVILTDYIRKEYLLDKDMDINKLGVLPIFKRLTTDYPNINMAILTGSIYVIPSSQQENLNRLCTLNNIDNTKINYEKLLINENYSIVKVPSSIRNKIMNQISKLFSDGLINVIIGTKSLLGEGWDEPSINTLVLASFVGSFMLSNQMRGRAIRVNSNPDKTANIWHLVCVIDDRNTLSGNADFETLKRRFTAFLGLAYDKDKIESGITRLGIIERPFTDDKINDINKMMENRAIARDSLINAWDIALNKTTNFNKMTNRLEADNIEKPSKKWFINKNTIIALIVFISIIYLIIFKYLKASFIVKLIEILIGIYLINKFNKIYKISKSENLIKEVGYVVLNSLYKTNFIKTPRNKIKLNVDKDLNGKISCYIMGTDLKESSLFTKSLEEVFSKTINQRYIITNSNKKRKELNEYYNVPTVLGTNKELAEVFSKYWYKRIGENTLIYTKTAEGRRLLLKARMKHLTIKEKITTKQELI